MAIVTLLSFLFSPLTHCLCLVDGGIIIPDETGSIKKETHYGVKVIVLSGFLVEFRIRFF